MIEGSGSGNMNPGEQALSVVQLSKQYPDIFELLADFGVSVKGRDKMSLNYLCRESGVEPVEVLDILKGHIQVNSPPNNDIHSITIIPGYTKSGKKEYFENIEIVKGETIAVVGPTGSGKSLLLWDIESMVQFDSPSKRSILVNGLVPDEEQRAFGIYKPIAQISQNMNYILDMTVEEFLDLHIESRGLKNLMKSEVVRAACLLCGEEFKPDVPIASLSGGQTRALMIADAIHISKAPVILVDEIENAGIDKLKAIDFLIHSSTIALIATHEPLIALMADKRIILKNGGIDRILTTTKEEKETLRKLIDAEKTQQKLKEALRQGKEIIL
jgi:ABC-type lipoprotein export system ATPase subunit